MEPDILKTAGQIAGIGGLALGVILILFREVIRKKVFPNLSEPDGYRLLRLVLLLAWSVGLVGIGAWIYARPAPPPSPEREFTISGLVTDPENNGLATAEVWIVGSEDRAHTSDSGAFSLHTRSVEGREVVLRVTHGGFRPRTENLKLPSTGLILSLSPLTAPAPVTPASSFSQPSRTDRPNTSLEGKPTSDAYLNRRVEESRSEEQKPSRTGRITIRYAGDFLACGLNLRMRIADKDVIPMGNQYPVSDMPLGPADYQIVGTIMCPTVGGCNASGSGRLNIQDGGNYNVIWQNTALGQCDVRLVQLP